MKKLVARFDQNITTCRKESTDDPREECITEDPEEEPISKDLNRTVSVRTLKNVLSPRENPK